jgi:hypothetical protein
LNGAVFPSRPRISVRSIGVGRREMVVDARAFFNFS